MTVTGNHRGFTLIEVVVVIIVAGILVGIALQSGSRVTDTGRIEQTKQELDMLARAIAGDPALNDNGMRSDFGYVGDVGALPPNLDALVANPGGYTTWRGPYTASDITNNPDDYKQDPWGKPYTYAAGVTITSTGSGSNITRNVAASVDQLLHNRVRGSVYDADGTPPGNTYDDSVQIVLTHPDGVGGLLARTINPAAGGYFEFDSVPIGNHDLTLTYLPAGDTLRRFVSVIPNSSAYAEFNFARDFWSYAGGSGGLSIIVGSDSVYATPQCNNISFWVQNSTQSSITASSIVMTWANPTAYYQFVVFNGVTVVSQSNPKLGTGDLAAFDAPQVIAPGESVRVQVEGFKTKPNGGQNVEMSNGEFEVLFSDGSAFTINAGGCQ